MLHLPRNIKLIRKVWGETQAQFGDRYGATVAMIKSYESGKASPDKLFLSRLAKDSDCSVEALDGLVLVEEDIMPVEKVEKRVSLKEAKFHADGSTALQIIDKLTDQHGELIKNNTDLVKTNSELVNKAIVSLGEILKAFSPSREPEIDQQHGVDQRKPSGKKEIHYRRKPLTQKDISKNSGK
jgi:transcriptional regulator with XRE-family HTH domain